MQKSVTNCPPQLLKFLNFKFGNFLSSPLFPQKLLLESTPTTMRSDLRAVTTNLAEFSQKATALLKQAEHIGTRTEGRKARHNQNAAFAISPKFHTKQEVKFTILAAEAFRVCGEQHWFDSAKAYSRAATLSADALHHAARAAELFTEAGIVTEKVDTNFANEYYSA
jgi:hypothetical protein